MIDRVARPLIFRENKRIFRAYLAEEYDGIGQYVNIALSRNSVTSGLRARIASGDFATGAHYPRGTEVLVFSDHGLLEVITLGANPQAERRREILVSDDPTNEVQTHFIIDTYENRVLSLGNAWGEPSRGTPNWETTFQTIADLTASLASSSASPGRSGAQLVVAALGSSGGWGRAVITLWKGSSSFAAGAGVTIRVPIPELDDWDEFRIEFDLVVAPASSNQGIAYAQIIIGGPSQLNAIDLTLQFEHFGSPINDHLDFFLARDAIGPLPYDTHSEQIAGTHSFDGHVTIDRSASRGTTLVTLGGYGTTEFTNAPKLFTPQKYLSFSFSDNSHDALNQVQSFFSVDNIELTNRP